MPWRSAKQMKLTTAEIDSAVELLVEQDRAHMGPCGDCGVGVGSQHVPGCDVARCLKCGGQRISCGCEWPEGEEQQVWTGLWPGAAECREHKLVARWFEDDGTPGGWTWDLNHIELVRAGWVTLGSAK